MAETQRPLYKRGIALACKQAYYVVIICLPFVQALNLVFLLMNYRRAKTPGGTFFFTVVTHNRRPFLCADENIVLLRQAFRYVMTDHPFTIDAIVILPEHLHCLWTLPMGDADFSTRWRLLKSHFSRHCAILYQGQVSKSRQRKQEKAVWQRRFWEHRIRDQDDFIRHVEYIHYNPVRHHLVSAPIEWPHSSFGRYVQAGVYATDWGTEGTVPFPDHVGYE